MVWLIRDLDDEWLDQNKVPYSFSGVKLPIVKYYIGSLVLRQRDKSLVTCRLLALEPDWLGFLLVASSLLPHLICFLVHYIGCARFCSVESYIVGLAISGAESRGANIAFGFSGWSLWKLLTIFQRCITANEGFQVFSSSG